MDSINSRKKLKLKNKTGSAASRFSSRSRIQRGSQLAEFGPALALLVGIVLLPLLDLVVLPIRWMLVQDMVTECSRQLSMCETFSQSQLKLNAEPSLVNRLQSLGGVNVRSVDLRLKISKPDGEEIIVVHSPGEIPQDCLPNPGKSACIYSLELVIDSLMAPALLLPNFGISIPGLNAPVPLLISASHEWENLGRDPVSKKFYMAQ